MICDEVVGISSFDHITSDKPCSNITCAVKLGNRRELTGVNPALNNYSVKFLTYASVLTINEIVNAVKGKSQNNTSISRGLLVVSSHLFLLSQFLRHRRASSVAMFHL